MRLIYANVRAPFFKVCRYGYLVMDFVVNESSNDSVPRTEYRKGYREKLPAVYKVITLDLCIANEMIVSQPL